jgi:hypothetical protein
VKNIGVFIHENECGMWDVLDPVAIKKNALNILNTKKILRIPINPKHEPTQHEYAIVIFIDDQYLELIRQSSSWLTEKFDYIKPDGYTILGRHTINQTQKTKPTPPLPALTFAGKPHMSNIKPMGDSAYESINLARGLLYALWHEPIQQGPTSESYHEFLTHTFDEKLDLLRTGKFAVMCQGFRDLFLHAASAVPHLKVRGINALNYAPPLTELISYGHSTVEIWIEDLNKWVLFDPWLGIMVARKNGDFVGAHDLQQNNEHPEYFNVVPVIATIPRMHKQHDKTIVHNTFHPTSIQMFDFSCRELGCSPGYIQYFNNVTIHPFIATG